MHMQNYKVLIKPEETQADLIAEICDDLSISFDEPFAFSAIEVPASRATRDSELLEAPTKDGLSELKVNCLVPQRTNPYTPASLITSLFSCTPQKSGVRYVQPPIDQWLVLFQPALHKMVSKAYPFYNKLFSKDELMSMLYFSITKLYKKGYYLHNNLVYRSFINEVNMEVNKLKKHQDDIPIDTPIGTDSSDNTITIGDTLIDQDETDKANELTHYTLTDYWQDMFELVKSTMLEEMSQLSFDRILLQLETKTIDNATAKKLQKLRTQFNPGYSPRPGRKKS